MWEAFLAAFLTILVYSILIGIGVAFAWFVSGMML